MSASRQDDAALQVTVQRALRERQAQEQAFASGPPPPYYGACYAPVGPLFQQQSGPTYILVEEQHPQPREIWTVPGHGESIPQPQQNRIVISGSARVHRGFFSDDVSSVSYVYADQLPCREKFAICLAVVMAVLGTPITLLCTLPAILLVHQSQNDVVEGDIQKARIKYKFYRMLLVFALVWTMIVVMTVIAVSVILGYS